MRVNFYETTICDVERENNGLNNNGSVISNGSTKKGSNEKRKEKKGERKRERKK